MKKAVILILSFLVMLIFNGCGGGGGGNENGKSSSNTRLEVIKNSVSVSLSCSTEGANIWYTKDGTDPKQEMLFYIQGQ